MRIHNNSTTGIVFHLFIGSFLRININSRTDILSILCLLLGNGILQISVFIHNNDLAAADCLQLAFIYALQSAFSNDTCSSIAFIFMLFQILGCDILHITGKVGSHFSIWIHTSCGLLYRYTFNITQSLYNICTLLFRNGFHRNKHIVLYPGSGKCCQGRDAVFIIFHRAGNQTDLVDTSLLSKCVSVTIQNRASCSLGNGNIDLITVSQLWKNLCAVPCDAVIFILLDNRRFIVEGDIIADFRSGIDILTVFDFHIEIRRIDTLINILVALYKIILVPFLLCI